MKSRFSPISLSSDALAHACGAQGCAWTNVFSGVKLWAICGAIRKGNCQLLAEGSNPITLAPRPSVFDAPPLKNRRRQRHGESFARDRLRRRDAKPPAATCLSGHRLNQASPSHTFTHTCRGRNLHPFRMAVMGLLLGLLTLVTDGQPPQRLRRCTDWPSKSV